MDVHIVSLLRAALPEGWPSGDSIHYGVLSGDDAHRFASDAVRVYVFSDDAAWNGGDPLESPRGLRVLAVFFDDAAPCGEIHTRDGAFTHAVLSARGESVLGELMEEWQTSGIPQLCRAEDGSCALIERLIPLRDRQFHVTVSRWLGSQSYLVLDSSAEKLERLASPSHEKTSRTGRRVPAKAGGTKRKTTVSA